MERAETGHRTRCRWCNCWWNAGRVRLAGAVFLLVLGHRLTHPRGVLGGAAALALDAGASESVSCARRHWGAFVGIMTLMVITRRCTRNVATAVSAERRIRLPVHGPRPRPMCPATSDFRRSKARWVAARTAKSRSLVDSCVWLVVLRGCCHDGCVGSSGWAVDAPAVPSSHCLSRLTRDVHSRVLQGSAVPGCGDRQQGNASGVSERRAVSITGITPLTR